MIARMQRARRSGGAVEYEAGGSTLVGFGTPRDRPLGSTGPIEVYEVGAGGAVMWHLEISGAVSSMYRATPVTSFSQR